MLERSRDPEAERGAKRARRPEPAPPLQFGTLGWASAMGNQAVARLARQSAEPPELEEEVEETEEAGPVLEELPEELPE